MWRGGKRKVKHAQGKPPRRQVPCVAGISTPHLDMDPGFEAMNRVSSPPRLGSFVLVATLPSLACESTSQITYLHSFNTVSQMATGVAMLNGCSDCSDKWRGTSLFRVHANFASVDTRLGIVGMFYHVAPDCVPTCYSLGKLRRQNPTPDNFLIPEVVR